jgi:hypothetical protein
MKKSWLLLFIIVLNFSCTHQQEKIRNIDFKLLQSDWLNANYGYILFFNDSTVLTPPNVNRQFVFKYHINFDTLLIQNTDDPKKSTWEKYKILVLNKDILLMRNISRNNFRLPYDSVSLINTKAINSNEMTYKRILFSWSLGYKKEVEIKGDSLTLKEYDTTDSIKVSYAVLNRNTVNQINRKLELLDTETTISTVSGPDVPEVTISVDYNQNVNPIEFKSVDPSPKHLRLAGFIAYLNNLDKILNIEKK